MDSCNLPSELVMEILTRTSLDTIGSSRVTCKKVNSMTYQSFFTKFFHKRAKQISGYFVEDLKKNKYYSAFVSMDDDASQVSLNFLPHRVKIEASTKQGILCCTSQETEHAKISRYYICKPSTKQWELIPNPKTRYVTGAIAMMVLCTKPLRYKIVRLSQHKRLPQSKKGPRLQYLHCEVFDSAVWAWKKLKHIEMWFCELFNLGPTISSGGMAHWLTTERRILAFDFASETFTIIQVPQHLLGEDYDDDRTIVEYKGKLGLMSIWMNQSFELWVMKDHKVQEWTRKWTLDLEDLRYIENYPSPGACYGTDFILVKGGHNMIFYNTKNGCSYVVGLKSGISPRFIYPYHSDFELVDMKKQ